MTIIQPRPRHLQYVGRKADNKSPLLYHLSVS